MDETGRWLARGPANQGSPSNQLRQVLRPIKPTIREVKQSHPKDGDSDLDFSVPAEVSDSDRTARSAINRSLGTNLKSSHPFQTKVSLLPRRLTELKKEEMPEKAKSDLTRKEGRTSTEGSISSNSIRALSSSFGPKVGKPSLPKVHISERVIDPTFKSFGDLKSIKGRKPSYSAGFFHPVVPRTQHPTLTKITEGVTSLNQFTKIEGTSSKLISLVTWDNGSIYEGETKDGQFHGQGVYRHPSGYSISGEFRNGLAEGKAKFMHGDLTYEGAWKQGVPHGTGVETRLGLYEYQGDFANGYKSGRGRMTIVNKGTYIGEFKLNHFSGKGWFGWKDGKVYIGHWKEGKMQGKGKMTWPDGRVYEGQYTNNLKEGPGTFKWADGRCFTGIWKDGVQDGSGKYTTLNGEKLGGRWHHGQFEEPERMDAPPSPTKD